MILIADSGATKSNWRIIHKDGKISQAQTLGYNPYHHSAAILEDITMNQLQNELQDIEIQEVYFYGAGCAARKNVEVVKVTLEKVFKNATIAVFDDMTAAARGLCGNREGIACILGTGANSCYYDGKEIIKTQPSMGYILADEGSGAYLGKMLLMAFVREELPAEIMERLRARFNLDRDSILAHVYQGDEPARYLASFSKFIFQNLKSPELYYMVHDALKIFFEKNIIKYDNYNKIPVHFSGSVAFYYGNIIRRVASELKINVQNITEDPIAGLTLYHQNQITHEDY